MELLIIGWLAAAAQEPASAYSAEDAKIDCAVVTGVREAAFILSAPALQEDTDPHSYRAMAGLHQSKQISMDIVLGAAGRRTRTPHVKTALSQVRKSLDDLTPKLPSPGYFTQWKIHVDALEQLYKTTEIQLEALRAAVCGGTENPLPSGSSQAR